MTHPVSALRWTLIALSLAYSLGLSSGAAPSGVHSSNGAASLSPSSWSVLSGSTRWDWASPTVSSMVAAAAHAPGQKTVHVKGYTKKDGTKVKGYDRKAPSKKGSTTTKGSGTTKHSTTVTSTTPARDSKGRFIRSDAAKSTFLKQSGYPKGRPGYVVDHIVPLACGGADTPSNMQWQTVAAAKAKDKTERVGCGK